MNMRLLAAVAFTGLAGSIAPAQTYTESADAGQQGVAFAEPCYAGGAMTRINGALGVGDVADAFVIQIVSQPFSASTVGLASFDTQLFLMNMDGTAVVSNDDNVGTSSSISLNAAPGFYILAISSYDYEPVDAAGTRLFSNNVAGQNIGVSGQRIWADFVPFNNTTPGGAYGIALLGAAYVSQQGPRQIAAAPGSTINARVNELSYGDTLLIPPGSVFLNGALTNAKRGRAFTIRGSGQAGDCEIRPLGGGAGFPAILFNATHEGPLTLFQNVTFQGFSAPAGSSGGVARLIESSPRFDGCTFRQNTSAAGISDGGACLLFDSSALVERCDFDSNQSSQFGGAIYIAGNAVTAARPVVRNCLFRGNSAPRGAALAIQTHSVSVNNCTFTRNLQSMGTIFANFSGRPEVDGSIVWGNTGSGDQFVIESASSGSILMNDTLTLSTEPGFGAGAGNIDQDPRFTDPLLPDARLRAGSPAIDRLSSSNALARLGPQDLDGRVRVYDDPGSPGTAPLAVDMGCFEAATTVACPSPPPLCAGDADGNGVVNFADITSTLLNYSNMCP